MTENQRLSAPPRVRRAQGLGTGWHLGLAQRCHRFLIGRSLEHQDQLHDMRLQLLQPLGGGDHVAFSFGETAAPPPPSARRTRRDFVEETARSP